MKALENFTSESQREFKKYMDDGRCWKLDLETFYDKNRYWIITLKSRRAIATEIVGGISEDLIRRWEIADYPGVSTLRLMSKRERKFIFREPDPITEVAPHLFNEFVQLLEQDVQYLISTDKWWTQQIHKTYRKQHTKKAHRLAATDAFLLRIYFSLLFGDESLRHLRSPAECN
jgi:hypothetical protein